MNTDIQLYPDESLESFLLRLSQFQGYERYSHFAEDIWYETLNSHEAIPGAFPLELNRVNIYHAQTTSQMRVRVLIQLEKQLKLNNYGVLRLALNHSKSTFLPDYKAVHRFGVDYPFAFLRKRFTPLCPSCLVEEPYIRQNWQFIPIQVCEKHQCKLVHRCPECKSLLEYQNIESITYCECGFDLRESEAEAAPNSELITAKWLIGDNSVETGLMSKAMTVSERYGVLLWYVNRYGDAGDISFDAFIEYCSAWPTKLKQDLDALVEKADVVRTKDWRKVFFSEAFGSLLKDCRQLPSRELSKNVVLAAVFNYLSELVADNPASSKGNVADVLLSPLDASTLLSCTTDEVYRLYEFGEIKAAIRPRMHTKIASHESAFTLRSIVETKLTRMCSETDGLNVYLPEW
ncbi:TniQ family protein [Vibrio sp. ZSDZ34]|uniref:TniQ family protein n=1 Tax=Vibrio gelatinilyticus TaxID=2893468 RepID=A0A9X1W6S2_9VIBR|nr:TniQ family protein [Vibrio gelatinilyticus]MCJ2375542.1 TniQ family protein [Vibrio gelatinilyticus]